VVKSQRVLVKMENILNVDGVGMVRKKKGTMNYYFCRNCNCKNEHSREQCRQCGRNLKDRLKVSMK